MLSDDPDTATVQTVQEMCRQINSAANDPLVRTVAQNAVRTYKGGPAWAGVRADLLNPLLRADSCYWWCKFNLKFRHHGEQFEAWSSDLGDPQTKLQLLISPDVLVRMRKMEGDCAIYTMMLCAMLKSLGLPYRIHALAVDPSIPNIFSHVCASSNGESLDASHGKYPGWKVPKEHTMREWTFDESAQRVGGFTGLHDYRRSRFRRRGMGADGADYQEGGDYFPPTADNPTQTFGPIDWGGAPQVDGGYSAPSRDSGQWAAFASNLAKMGFTLAQINSIQPGTVVSANGAILRQNPGYAVPAGGTISANLGSTSSILLYGGLGIGLLLLFSSLKGGR
jgi:hypothetical protein